MADYERWGRAVAAHLAARLAQPAPPEPAGFTGGVAGSGLTLAGLGLLGLPPDAVIDRVVARVRSAFGVEGSSLTRLGRRDGAASSSARAGGQATTSRSASLALATVRAPDGLAVTNLRDDTRFRHSRLASRHGMAFFAGYRVEVPTGEAVAVLAIFDRLPRTFSAQEMDLLRDHARLIEQAFTPAIAGSGAPESHGGVPGRRHNTAV